ncbi:MAG: hypothetical protein CMG69_00790 [Candidatus Marinimicrobia bacterium]|nr:hypothetical protein [Candidatus Neomarinimicrobiota bacterium]|tara:strand:- start:20615 stop:22510 length:1896 start_codon:yes stop_codon:yes gene_type:complete
MKKNIQTKSIINVLLLGILFLNISCVYYNTFYNAKKYFRDAEKVRLANEDRSLPANAQTSYAKVIDKCELVLEKYPESEYVFSALHLSGQSHYHREEYNSAELKMNQLALSQEVNYKQQSEFWLALIKWKKGKTQSAIDKLNLLLNEDLISVTPTLIHLYLADIYIELKNVEKALEHLETAAENSFDSQEKGRIYQRLSELAFKRKEYDRALNAYNQVIKNSLVKKLKLDAHLQTAKIYRLTGNYETAVKKIKSLLVDEEFRELFGALELELVRIYDLKNESETAVERLQSIIKDYSSTEVAAEAYFMLGLKSISIFWNLESAKEYFEKSNKENRKSPVLKESQEMIKYIDQYLSAVKVVFTNNDSISQDNDSLKTRISNKKLTKDNLINRSDESAIKLLRLAELEAFQFNKPDSALRKVDMFLKYFPTHELYPKVIYMDYFLQYEKGDSIIADSIAKILTTKFPDTEYADAVRKNLGLDKELSKQQENFRKAETLWYLNKRESALDSLRSIVYSDTSSDHALISGYFLGYQYDYTVLNPDSALKYYTWVSSYFPDSEQASQSKIRMNQIKLMLTPPDTNKLDIDSSFTKVGDTLKLEAELNDTTNIISPKFTEPKNDSLKFKIPKDPNEN